MRACSVSPALPILVPALKPDLVVATHVLAGRALCRGGGGDLGRLGWRAGLRGTGEGGSASLRPLSLLITTHRVLRPPHRIHSSTPALSSTVTVVVMATLGCPATSPWCTSHDRHGPIRMAVEKQVSLGQSPPSFLSLPLPQVLVLITIITVGKLCTPF